MNVAKSFVYVCVCVFVCVFPSDREMAQFLLGLHNLKIAQLFFIIGNNAKMARPSQDGRAFCGSSYGSAPS